MRRHDRAGAAFALTMFFVVGFSSPPSIDADGVLRTQAIEALHKAGTFYRNQVASHGGYVYYYSLDLKQRWGEGEASPDQVWVQPPGTPTVGMAFLTAYRATNDRFYLDAAREAAEALAYGQLRSGGWTNCVDFDPKGQRVAQYRHGKGRGKNNSTLDDGISQAAIGLMIHVDQALGFDHEAIHASAQFALESLLKAQFPNGGFPQVWTGPVPAQKVLNANYPEYDWRTEGKIKNYWNMYTLNDNVAGNTANILIDAYRIYKDERYKSSVSRLGDFLILAQMPNPQPAWAQQYNYQMQPIWARRFEPPAITGSESQDAMLALIRISQFTGDKKYLEPIPRALDYLKRSRLSDGRLARFYELRTNKPLYMKRIGQDYSLTYDDANLPDHYGWKISFRLEEIQREYNALNARERRTAQESSREDLEQQVRKIVQDLDKRGRWISTYTGQPVVGQPNFRLNSQYIGSDVFSRNVELLSQYLGETAE